MENTLIFWQNLIRYCQCLIKFYQKKKTVFSISKKQKIRGERYRNFHTNYYLFLLPSGMKFNRFSILMQNFHRSLSFETILYFFMFMVFFVFLFQLHPLLCGNIQWWFFIFVVSLSCFTYRDLAVLK